MGNTPVDVTDEDVAQAAEAQAAGTGRKDDSKAKKTAAKKASG